MGRIGWTAAILKADPCMQRAALKVFDKQTYQHKRYRVCSESMQMEPYSEKTVGVLRFGVTVLVCLLHKECENVSRL